MSSEPTVACPRCQTPQSLADGISQDMRCQVCGANLITVDTRWISNSQSGDLLDLQPLYTSLDYKVAEILLPAHNQVDEEAVGQFITSLPLPISLELFGHGDRRVMLARGPEEHLRYLAGKLQTLWPSAILKILDEDPVFLDDTSDVLTNRFDFSFPLKEEGYLPIRTWKTFLQGDPMLTLMASTLGLKSHEKIWLQVLIARKGTPQWLAKVQERLKLEAQRGFTVNESGIATQTPTFNHIPLPQTLNWANGFSYVLFLIFLLVLAILGIQGHWGVFAILSFFGILIGAGLYYFVGMGKDPWRGADLSLVRQKVVYQDTFYQVILRASITARTPGDARLLATRLDGAMSQYSLAGGNRFHFYYDPFERLGSWPIQMVHDEQNWNWLGPDELAGLWHPPIVDDQVSPGLVPVRGVEMRAPDPEDVSGFYQIGNYVTSDGERKAVNVSSNAMRHNIFCIGKPDTGKSNLMLHLTRAALELDDRPAVIMIDPHGDLTKQLYGSINPDFVDNVRILNIKDQEYVFPINPCAMHREGWGVTDVANSIVDIGQSIWPDYWGPRMQVPLKRAVELLVAANELRPEDASFGLQALAPVLSIHPDARRSFIAGELEGSPHRQMLSDYFFNELDTLTPHFKEQVISPVLSKAYRFQEIPMLPFFSSPISKLDMAEIIRDRKILIIDTGMNKFGFEISNFTGSLIINLVLMEMVRQGELSQDNRAPVTIVIDEFQNYTGVNWEALFQQMRKYGGRMILGTQSLASLREQNQELPEIIFSGVYSLFAFTMNGIDARYLSEHELSGDKGGPSADTLIGLDQYKTYARLERATGGVSRPFYFETVGPPDFDAMLADDILRRRANYSIPYEEAEERARATMFHIKRYRNVVSSEGAHQPSNRTHESPTTSQAADILLAGLSDEGSDGNELRVDLPWEIDTNNETSSKEPAEDAHEIVMGREITEEQWDDFLGLHNLDDHPGDESRDGEG